MDQTKCGGGEGLYEVSPRVLKHKEIELLDTVSRYEHFFASFSSYYHYPNRLIELIEQKELIILFLFKIENERYINLLK